MAEHPKFEAFKAERLKNPEIRAAYERARLARRCPRKWCRGRLPHSRLVHWFGWVRR